MRKLKYNQESWVTLTPKQEAEIRLIIMPDHYRVLQPHELPEFLPSSFRTQIINGIAMTSNISSGWILVANWQRLDIKAQAIDQEPFGIFLVSSNASALSSGMYLHHGSWPGRTTPIPFPVASSFLTTDISSLWPLTDPPPDTYGPLEDLKGTSHERALEAIIRKLTK